MAQSFVNGYSMRLELTGVCSFNGFLLLMVFFNESHSFLFLRVCFS